MKTIEKRKLENMDTKNMVLTGHTKANNYIIKQIAHELNCQSAFVYIVLLSHRNQKNNLCFPTRQVIADECGVSLPYVKVILKNLKDKGFIKIETGTLGYANHYTFPLEDHKNNSIPKPNKISPINF